MIPLSIFTVNLLSENLLLLASILVFAAILVTKLGSKFGAPSLLLFLLLGMAVGEDGLGLHFEDYEMAESIGHFAMTIIMFTAGFETSLAETKPVFKQGVSLSTLGLVITILLTGFFIRLLSGIAGNMELIACFILAATISSTDSASVFSVLRDKNLNLRENLKPLLELESGSNDPIAYMLTITLVGFFINSDSLQVQGSWAQLSDDGEKWSPSTTAVWNSRKCNNLCCFKCSKTYFWTGNECINLCDADPCKGVAHSTEECTSVNVHNYACGCEENYYWWGPKRGCIAQKPASGNICTGAHECFNNSEKIECPASGEDFYGQDAQYAAAGACVLKAATSNIEFDESVFETLTVSGDEVITDSTTGFMWQKNSDFNGEQREWRQALNYCENLVYAGYSDWRLPNKNELLSLVNYKNDNPDSDFSWFEDDTNQYYFSSSTARYYKEVSEISSIDGNTADVNKTGKDYQSNGGSVRCVRSDICEKGFFLKGSECVSNPCGAKSCKVANSTGICMPKTESAYECQCVDGYFWNGSKCVNPCDADPCSKIANSDKNCTPVNSTLYFCGCNEGFGWNNGKCTAYATDAVTLGNICTGDILCFDKGLEIECPAENESYYGQDAQYAASGLCKKQDFELKTVSDQEIVVDKNTKLEWQHTVSEKTYTWNDAFSYCENLEYGGYSDWRLPEPLELMTITDYGAYDSCGADDDESTPALVNWLYFKDIMPSFAVGSNLWTSKENLEDYSRAWGFSPKRGHAYSYPLKTYHYNVMCVRGNKLPKAEFKKLLIRKGKVVNDLTTRLMWQKGFTKMENETWENALSYCENLTYAGFSDWRLPNKNELVSLVSYDKDDPFSILFDIPDEYGFVSSTTRRIDINPAINCFSVYIYNIEIFMYAEMINIKGELKGVTKSKGSFNVRCVRNME